MALAFVQSNAVNTAAAGANATQTCAYSSNVAGGNLLCVFGMMFGTSPVVTAMAISDTLGNIWTPVYVSLQTLTGTPSNLVFQGWYCLNKVAGSNANTVTVNFTNSTTTPNAEIAVVEFSGFSSLEVLDQKLSVLHNGVLTAVAELDFTTLLTNEVIFCFSQVNAVEAGSTTVNSPFVKGSQTGGANNNLLVTYCIAATAGSYKLTGTYTTASGNTTLSIGFSISAGQTKTLTAATASLAATLSRKTTAILTAATASMAGVLLKRTGKAFAAATASLAATLTRALTNVITFIASTASMAATLTRQTGKALVAAISSFAAQLIKRTSYFLMAATASFAATLTRATAQSFIAATTLFSATLNRSTVKTITAAMSSFAAAINKKISLIFAAATSSFSASISEGLEFSVFFTAAMALFSAILSTLLKKNPFVNRGPAVKRFGVSSVFPAVISTATNDLIFFEQPEPTAFTNQDLVQLNLPAAGSGTADDWGGLGQRVMAGKLLVAPGNGRLGGKTYLLAASGDITIPSSASGATVNLILNQNDFSVAGQVVSTVSNMIATTGVPVSLNPGTVSWSLACTLRDNGVHNSFLEGRFTFTIDQNSYSGVLQVRVPGNEEPQLQLSLGAQFGGTVSGSDMFQIRATQYELQQLGLPNKTNQASI